MRFMVILAALGGAFSTPANAATWIMNFEAYTTGTFSKSCGQPIPECMRPVVTPISGPVGTNFSTEDFIGTKFIQGAMSGDFSGYYATYSFFLDFDGVSMSGRDFKYYEGGTGNSQFTIWQTSAPTVTISTIPRVPGPVPEPAAWILMLLGVGAIGTAMRRAPKRTIASFRVVTG